MTDPRILASPRTCVSARLTKRLRHAKLPPCLGLPTQVADLLLRIICFAVVLGVSGCASTPHSSDAARDQLEHERIGKLLEQDPRQAREALAARLRARPQNGYYHLLNGLSYQLASDSRQSLTLAKVGYDAAARFAPGSYWAHYLDGYTSVELRSYPEAAEHFSRAILLDPGRFEGFLGLAVAAYLAGDLDVAQPAAQRAALLAPENELTLRTAAYVAAARGDEDALNQVLARARSDPRLERAVRSHLPRLNQLLRTSGGWRAAAAGHGDAAANTVATPAAFTTQSATTEPATSEPPESPAPVNASALEARPPSTIYALFEDPVAPGGYIPAPSASAYQQSTYTPPAWLPPATGPSPEEKDQKHIVGAQQVMVEVTVLLNQASTSESVGINLLDGLTVQFGLEHTTNDTISPAGDSFTRVFTTAISVPDITYSLNLFNTRSDYYRVLARPSLVAYLGEESEFFIGRTVNVGVSGINIGLLQPVDVGLSIKLTPTEVTPFHTKFKVQIIRSFFAPDQAGTFTQSLTTFKQTVAATAEVEFGKTLILSGLYEGVDIGAGSKTPVVGDIPGLNALFNARNNQRRRDVALVLVTPRLPGSVQTDSREFRGETLKSLLSLWQQLVDPASNLAAIIQTVRNRSKDLRISSLDSSDVQLPPVAQPAISTPIIADTIAQLNQAQTP
jgi:Flp pilus assembly protein TadD